MSKIEMVSVPCDKLGHQGQNIGYLCLNSDCKEQSTVCFKCSMKGHDECKKYMKELEDVPKSLLGFELLQSNLVDLQKQINELFKQLLVTIEQLIKPIAQYQDTQNLTNLKAIGSMLRGTTKQTIIEHNYSTMKKIRSVIDKFGDSMIEQKQTSNSNLGQNSIIKQQEPQQICSLIKQQEPQQNRQYSNLGQNSIIKQQEHQQLCSLIKQQEPQQNRQYSNLGQNSIIKQQEHQQLCSLIKQEKSSNCQWRNNSNQNDAW